MILALLLQVAVADFNHQEIAKHLVYVYSQQGSCSGVVVADRRVITAEHCYAEVGLFRKRPNVFVSRTNHSQMESPKLANRDKNPTELAGVIQRDKELDLMYLEASVIGDPIEFGEPVIDEEIMIVAYPLGEYRAVRGRITGITGNGIVWTDMNIMAGSSGGGAFNKRGQLVGIVSQVRTDGFNSELHLRHPKAVELYLPKEQSSHGTSGSGSSLHCGCSSYE